MSLFMRRPEVKPDDTPETGYAQHVGPMSHSVLKSQHIRGRNASSADHCETLGKLKTVGTPIAIPRYTESNEHLAATGLTGFRCTRNFRRAFVVPAQYRFRI